MLYCFISTCYACSMIASIEIIVTILKCFQFALVGLDRSDVGNLPVGRDRRIDWARDDKPKPTKWFSILPRERHVWFNCRSYAQ